MKICSISLQTIAKCERRFSLQYRLVETILTLRFLSFFLKQEKKINSTKCSIIDILRTFLDIFVNTFLLQENVHIFRNIFLYNNWECNAYLRVDNRFTFVLFIQYVRIDIVVKVFVTTSALWKCNHSCEVVAPDVCCETVVAQCPTLTTGLPMTGYRVSGDIECKPCKCTPIGTHIVGLMKRHTI